MSIFKTIDFCILITLHVTLIRLLSVTLSKHKINVGYAIFCSRICEQPCNCQFMNKYIFFYSLYFSYISVAPAVM